MSASYLHRSWGRRVVTTLAGSVSAAMVLSGCSVYDVPLPGGADTGEDPMKVTLMFRDVLDLVPQSTVKVDDVTVGKVKTVKLKGYVAEVAIELRKDVDLPDNARAEIRQTSLLGEKFVSLNPPQEPGSGKLSDKDVIGLDRTGRNPEVEEVLGALSLLLNGGGVAQLKTIVTELNNTFEGRESEVRSVLDQIRSFMGQLDQNKGAIVKALENTNRLALQLKRQDATIKSALDNVPDTLRSVNRQREDLVRLLEALNRLSGVGVRVIQASKESTINSLRDLAPVLDGFAKAGENFPKAFQVFLTYPFVDEAVGRDPAVARNLHMGDYTNLSINLDLGLETLGDVLAPVCDVLDQVLDQTRAAVNRVADAAVAGLANIPLTLITAQQRQELRKAIVDDLLGGALDTAKSQCRTPDVPALTTSAANLVTTLLRTLGILLPAQVQQLLAGALGTLTGVLAGLTRAGTVRGGTIQGGNGGLLGGNQANGGTQPNGGLLGGLGGALSPRPRVAPGASSSGPLDPFGLAAYGRDPGIGTMLLQGVAETR